jgi:hypothetical protein
MNRDPEEGSQRRTINSLRRGGWFFVACIPIGLYFSDFRKPPLWPHLVGLGLSVYFSWSLFRAARRIAATTPEEWAKRRG